ncbi:MAG: phosphopantetheine adenylyltransferase [Promethearchaeota archaeon]
MTLKKYSVVGLGGTFDRLHKGHKALLQKAFEIGEHVLIGITSEEMLSGKDNAKKIQPYTQRVKNMENHLKTNGLLQRAKIVKLSDRYGPAITMPEMEAIIVTEETRPTAEEINNIRKANRLVPLAIISVPRVLADDGLPISSSRIRAGIIDKNGEVPKKHETP